MNIMNKYFKNINLVLLILTIIFLLFFITIVFLYINEKNTTVQLFLHGIHKKINGSKQLHSLVNPNYKVTEQNNVIIVHDFLEKSYFNYIRKQFDIVTS